MGFTKVIRNLRESPIWTSYNMYKGTIRFLALKFAEGYINVQNKGLFLLLKDRLAKPPLKDKGYYISLHRK